MASATGRSVKEVILDSYAHTLYTFLALEDVQRLERLLTEADQLVMGDVMAYAFNEPKKLADMKRRFKARAQGKMPKEDLMRLAAGLLQREAEGLARLKGKAKKKPRR